MAKQFNRNRTTWVAYLLLALYSYCLNLLGPITPFLRDEFHLSYTVSGLHLSAFAVGILVIGLAGHWVIARSGRQRALAIGALGLGVGGLLLVLGRTPVVTIGASFLMGCVGSLILAVVPPTLSEEHGEMRGIALSEANFLASLIAAAAPLLVGWLAHLVVGWRPALILAALSALVGGGLLFRPKGAQRPGSASAQPAGQLPLLFWFYWVGIVLAVSVEFCMLNWVASYMQGVLGLPLANAAQCVSLFLGGMIIGRLLASWLLRYFSARRVVIASILLGMLGFMLFWSTASVPVAMAGLVLAGLGVASLYPVILSLAIGTAPAYEGQAGARATLASGVAILALPLLLGRLADLAGLKAAYSVVAVLLVVVLLMMVGVELLTPKLQAAQPQPSPDCEPVPNSPR